MKITSPSFFQKSWKSYRKNTLLFSGKMLAIFQISHLSFREGIVLWPNVRSISGSKGRIELTKNIRHDQCPTFIAELIDILDFPCWLSIDAFGFVQDPEKDLTGFQWVSKASGLVLMNDQTRILIDDYEIRLELYNQFLNMNGETFLQKWFESHNRISRLQSSGFGPKSVTTLVAYIEPLNISVKKLFNLE